MKAKHLPSAITPNHQVLLATGLCKRVDNLAPSDNLAVHTTPSSAPPAAGSTMFAITPEHQVLLANGQHKRVADLDPGDQLAGLSAGDVPPVVVSKL